MHENENNLQNARRKRIIKDVQNVSCRKGCRPHYETKFLKSTRERSISAHMLITGIARFQPLSLKQCNTMYSSTAHLDKSLPIPDLRLSLVS
jgi:hypothetical protein